MIAEVIVDVISSGVDRIFDYKIPADFSVVVGDRVVVPFGKRVVDGYVLGIKEKSSLKSSLLKEIISVKTDGKILPEMVELCKFMVERYNIKNADALRLCMTSEIRSGKVKAKTESFCEINREIDVNEYINKLRKGSEKQADILNALKGGRERRTALEARFGVSPLRTLVRNGAILLFEEKQNRPPASLTTKEKTIKLNSDQLFAINEITKFQNKTYLLFGVTGSGKTEVYMNAIEKALENGKTAILLVPEISLTPQVFSNLKNRFGEMVAVLHSGLSAGERYDEWNRIQNGEAKVVVGARSAIFAPIKNIGIIIIDEEHENSYNSETNPRYKTIDIAHFRQNYNKCPLVLGSATPSVETFQKTVEGAYQLLELPHRVHEIDMPKVQVVDMIGELHSGNDSIFSRQLIADLENCFAGKKQALLFQNRRGYTSFMRCCECGYIAKCTDCDAPLVYHKDEDKLKCHFCGKRYQALTICPNCKSPHIRQGAVGTQKVVDEIQKLFPNVPVFRMDNDTTRNKNGHQKILEEFSKHKPAILVGTQMIAKGHDFSDVEVVGIIDADQSLYQSDYKSAEKTFQIITQVSGRAGRKDGGGKIVLQTYSPKHYVYKYVANYNYKGFFDKEINIRDTTNFPPFSTIVRVLISYEKEAIVAETTKDIYNELKELKQKYGEEIIFLDAMKSPHTRLKNKFRYQILLRFTKRNEYDIIKQIYEIVNKYQARKSSTFVEINPSNLS